MATTLFKLVGALASATLVADVSYIQFVAPPEEAEAGSGAASAAVRDLFDAYIDAPWDDVVRIAALVLAALGAAGTALEVLCPRMVARVVAGGRRRAGTLVASTTSAI